MTLKDRNDPLGTLRSFFASNLKLKGAIFMYDKQ